MAKSSFRDRPHRNQPQKDLSLKERFKALTNLPKLFALVWEVSPAMVSGNLMLRLLRSFLPLLHLYFGKLIIDEVIRLLKTGDGHDFTQLWIFIVLEFGVAMISDLLGRGIAYIDSMLGDRFSNASSIRLMEHAAKLDLEHFEDSAFYDKLERARQQTVGRMTLMSQVFSQGQDILTMAFLATGLIVFNPWLIVLLLVTLLPAFWGESYFNTQSYSIFYSWTPERRMLDYLRMVGASNESAKEVKMFGLSPFLIEEYRVRADHFYETNKKLGFKRASVGGFLSAIGSAGYYGAYAYIIFKTVIGVLSVGDLTFLSGSFARLRGLLEGILARFTTIADSSLYLQDMFDFFEIQPKITSPKNPRPFPNPIREGFRFENVGFKYAHSDRFVLKELNFLLKAGEKLALVGENGAGKTTLVKLLVRLYDPTEGHILLDGYDVKDYDLEEFRREVGVIFQDFMRYHLSAGDNIAVGRIEHRNNLPQIETAARESLAESVIKKLPYGYMQTIGKRFPGGVELSGGEWQKVALARAYIRDAQLLVLDEPTAALDARAEHEVFQHFTELTKGKTAVLISHRFSTVRMADRILVLENGTLLEIGSHEELLLKNGRYAELFKLQAAGYL
jgi:ATP-binding cassette subfamily B protein